MLSPISMQSTPVQQAQPAESKPQAASAAPAASTPTVTATKEPRSRSNTIAQWPRLDS
jgi:hypothetical protein